MIDQDGVVRAEAARVLDPYLDEDDCVSAVFDLEAAGLLVHPALYEARRSAAEEQE